MEESEPMINSNSISLRGLAGDVRDLREGDALALRPSASLLVLLDPLAAELAEDADVAQQQRSHQHHAEDDGHYKQDAQLVVVLLLGEGAPLRHADSLLRSRDIWK